MPSCLDLPGVPGTRLGWVGGARGQVPLFLAPIFSLSGFRQDVLAAHTSAELACKFSPEGSVSLLGTKASSCAGTPGAVSNALTQSSRETAPSCSRRTFELSQASQSERL